MDKNGFYKKILLIALTAAMCVSVSSCKQEEKKSALREASNSEEQSELLEQAKAQSEAGSASPSPTDESGNAVIGGADGPTDVWVEGESNANEASGESAPAEYAPGTLTDTTYESAYIGVRFTVPDGYSMVYTPDDIAHLNEQLANDANEGQRSMKYEMSVANTDENMQVIVSVDGDKGDYDEITYLSNVAANYENAVNAEINRTPFYATIAGVQYTAMQIKTGQGDILYCVRKNGSDMITFIISYPDGADDKIGNVMNAFQPY
jgi:hypothetical protein